MSQTEQKPFKSALIRKYEPKILERVWGREIFVCETDDYLVKLLFMNKGAKGGLQLHVEKAESFHLLNGEAWVEHDDGSGEIVGTYMYAGETFDIPPKAVHRVEAITDCVFVEGSTPTYDDRFHCESLYGLDAETGGLPSTFVLKDGEFVKR